jgi:hypothetical protein
MLRFHKKPASGWHEMAAFVLAVSTLDWPGALVSDSQERFDQFCAFQESL